MNANERIEQSITDMSRVFERDYVTSQLIEELVDSFQSCWENVEVEATSILLSNVSYVVDYALNAHFAMMKKIRILHNMPEIGFKTFVSEKQSNCHSVLVSKQAEYASKNSRFQNFYTAQAILGRGTHPETTVLMFALKHLSSIVDIGNMDGEEFSSKWPTFDKAAGILAEKYGDLYNYMHLLCGLIEEVHNG